MCSFTKENLNNFDSKTVLILNMGSKNSTHIFDLSGNRNDCYIYQADCNVNGINRDGCYFDRLDDYLDCGNHCSLNSDSSFSVSA